MSADYGKVKFYWK